MTGDRIPDELKPGGEYDTFVAGLAAKDEFSGTILLSYHDHPVLERSYGMANKKRRIPNGPDTIFCLGSIPKMFTGVAIGQLAQRGKVAYHEKLGTYLDGFAPEIADTVTIDHLLTHTSGLGDFHSAEYFEQARDWNSVEEVWNGTVKFVREDTLSFPPGSAYQYSNSGYFALGAIVQATSGQSYYDYIREHVFRPAGMTSTDFYTLPRWMRDRRMAHPYHRTDNGEWVDVIDDNVFVGLPAGGAFSNTTDLARFASAVMRNQLLDPAYTLLTISPKRAKEAGDGIGFGTYAPGAHLLNDTWVLGHNGGAQGVYANLDWFPNTGWKAIIFSNYSFTEIEHETLTSLPREYITGQGARS